MISELEYVIGWMTSGRNPNMRRWIDKAGVYLTDQNVLDELLVHNVCKSMDTRGITDFEKELIENAICTLTEREKDVFFMIKVKGLTFE